jgi:uracil phosphoribosyltransferase
MKKTLLTILRDKKTSTSEFRRTTDKMAHLLAQEAMEYVKEKKRCVSTPLKRTSGSALADEVTLVPVLRAGLSFLPAFLFYFEDAKVGFVGLRRDENTAIAYEYYKNIPKASKNNTVILLDPMLATGGSAISAIESLKISGFRENKIIFVSLIAAPSGYKKIKHKFPKIKIILGVMDESLNKNKFIVPGIGDFGDRYFDSE